MLSIFIDPFPKNVEGVSLNDQRRFKKYENISGNMKYYVLCYNI